MIKTQATAQPKVFVFHKLSARRKNYGTLGQHSR